MNNENLNSQIPSSETITPASKSKGSKTLLFVLICVALLAVAILAVYEWQHIKLKNAALNVTQLNSQVLSLNQQLSSASKTTSTSQTSQPSNTTITETLDNGTKITYPLTTTNANVIWWSQTATAPASSKIPPSGTMVLSDKRIVQYITSLPLDALQPSCLSSGIFTDTSIQMGIYNPKTKVFGKNQYANCIDTLANDSKYATQAKKVLNDANADLEAFEKSITVAN